MVWRWLPTLFSAEAIPCAMITFVALLMFLQQGVSWAYSTLLCALLNLPWVLKSFVRSKISNFGHFALIIKTVEFYIFLFLVGLAFCFVNVRTYVNHIFICLFVLSCLCAWHELAARMYYERTLFPREQRLYNAPKIFFSQSSMIITYGVMLMAVGTLEVFFRYRSDSISDSWGIAVYALAGIYLLIFIYNLWAIRPPSFQQKSHDGPIAESVRREVRVIERIRQKPHWKAALLLLFILLLPQALLFHTRVLFLIAPTTDSGLGLTLIQVGFAQGTIGVMAFSAALAAGHHLLIRRGPRRTYWPFALSLGISPLVYLLMSLYPPTDLFWVCVATFVAQGCFGFGLNICMLFVRYISGERYRNTVNYLYIPLVSFLMLLPTAASGWLAEQSMIWAGNSACSGFLLYFLIDSATVPLAWIASAVIYFKCNSWLLPVRK
ncbi:MAG: hypothetical protein K6F94_01840 [Bacteroidaceae bacterium]|nr:hypothetical protein [Bacteroidaceae bacterium]